MRSNRRRTLQMLLFMLITVSTALAIILYQLRANINYFYTPSDLVSLDLPATTKIRVGGYVVNQSIRYNQDGSAAFVLTDRIAEVPVIYHGILPTLFREDDEAVVVGKQGSDGVILATQVMAKHDENYRPPELKELQRRAYGN